MADIWIKQEKDEEILDKPLQENKEIEDSFWWDNPYSKMVENLLKLRNQE